MPHLAFDTFVGQIFWLLFFFVAFYFLVSKLLLPNVASVLDDRAKHIADDVDSAETMKNNAVDAQIKYERTQEKATAEARKTLDAAIAKSEENIAAKRKDLQAKIDKSLAAAEKKIAEVQDESAAVIAKVSKDIADQMAKKVAA